MKEVNIYGTGINALKFLLSNKNDIKVSCFIEGKKDISSFMGYKVVNISDATKEFNARYTVVASSENVYFEIKRTFEKEYGLVEFEDFEYSDTYNKKNCYNLWKLSYKSA